MSEKISIVIPCYNESDNIDNTYQLLTNTIKNLVENYDIIIVDNGGTDGQLEIMKTIYEKDKKHVKVISLSRNFGYQISMSAGLEYVESDAVILIDADLQDPPSMIKDFIEKWKKGYDVVYGIREKREGSIIRNFFYRFFYMILNKTSDIEIPRNVGEFGLMSKKVVDQLKLMPENIRFIRGMRSWVGYKQIGIPYSRLERKKGNSKFRFFDNLTLGMDGILSFSTRILTFSSMLGLFTIFISFVIIIYIVTWKLFSGDLIPGYAAIMVTISFFSGIIIFMLGIAGAFIERIFLEVKSRPKFIVKELWGIEN
tara:strand:+ start:15164 stop:16099 length:936 start_codon:yes stop_codon:yes gene_type:complete